MANHVSDLSLSFPMTSYGKNVLAQVRGAYCDFRHICHAVNPLMVNKPAKLKQLLNWLNRKRAQAVLDRLQRNGFVTRETAPARNGCPPRVYYRRTMRGVDLSLSHLLFL